MAEWNSESCSPSARLSERIIAARCSALANVVNGTVRARRHEYYVNSHAGCEAEVEALTGYCSIHATSACISNTCSLNCLRTLLDLGSSGLKRGCGSVCLEFYKRMSLLRSSLQSVHEQVVCLTQHPSLGPTGFCVLDTSPIDQFTCVKTVFNASIC